jgi:hypothetical protein
MLARLWLASLSLLLLAQLSGACKSTGVANRPAIAVRVGGNEMTDVPTPRYQVPFVAAGSTARIVVALQNTGRAELEVELPELGPVDWIWAAEGSARSPLGQPLWPVASLTLGGQIYDVVGLVKLLKRGDAGSDASVALVQPLIETKLSIAAGGPEALIADTVAAAEAWLDANAPGGLPAKIAPASAEGQAALALVEALAAYADTDNPHLSFDPDGRFTGEDFPLVVARDAVRTVEWLYAPTAGAGQEVDGRPVMLTIRSNDRFDNEEVRVLLQFTGRKATIRVQPSVVILVNPTSARPVTETISVHNDGSDRLVIESITLERADDREYDLIIGTPVSAWYVLPKSDPGYTPLTFQVRYAPRAATAENAILITSNDTSNRTLRVPIRIQTQERANCVFTYEDQAKGFLDFVGRPHGSEKVVSVYNEGPSNCLVKNLTIEPPLVRTFYSVRLQTPATTPGGSPTVVSPPLSLSRDRSAEIVVTFNGNADDPQNGSLSVAYENPQAGQFFVPILGGAETPVLAISPDSNQVHITAAVGSSGRGTFVIANNGTGDLTIDDMAVPTSDWENLCEGVSNLSPYFTVDGGPHAGLTVPSFGLLPVTVTYAPPNDEPRRTAQVHIAHRTPEGDCVETNVTIIGTLAGPERPVAAFAVSPNAPTAGESLLLDAGSSTAPAGDPIWSSGYSWYLAGKPSGSKLILSETTGPVVQLRPDLAGTYRIVLVVFTSSGVYSGETAVDVVVQ